MSLGYWVILAAMAFGAVVGVCVGRAINGRSWWNWRIW